MQQTTRNLKIHVLIGTDFFLFYNQESQPGYSNVT
jgi:hypothetical protein